MKINTPNLSSHFFKAKENLPLYLERTQRNRYWIGCEENQLRLKNLRVGVAGLGGMGSNIAEILVRLGVGHLKLADPDTIDTSNLNRQVIANRSTIGMKKALASARELQGIAEDIEITVYDDGITEKNANDFVSDIDILIDEIDVAPIRAHIHLHQAARKRNLPIYSGYIIGLGSHIYKYQGDQYTFEDFMENRSDMYDQPTYEFLVDRFFWPRPSYCAEDKCVDEMIATAKASSFPIFGASTFGAQSCLVIRMISDFLGLHDRLGSPPTPLMPKFIKMDALDYTFKVCDIREQGKQKKAA